MLSELFEKLPEVGDLDQPKLVYFFDEAHLLFDDAPAQLRQRVEQVVRLIRSKGVGVYFVTQNPLDVPDTVLAQLGNRIQHALRAYTPREQKAVQTAAETFRPNPDFDCARVITQLGVGEALVSTLGEKAVPSVVQRTLIRPPSSRIGPITDAERKKVMDESPVSGQYDKAVDRESAFEMLQKKANDAADAAGQSSGTPRGGGASGGSVWGEVGDILVGTGGGRRQSVAEAAVKSVVRSVGSSLGRALVRGILGGLTRR
jgi:DNA helicase HerA-like ATPase